MIVGGNGVIDNRIISLLDVSIEGGVVNNKIISSFDICIEGGVVLIINGLIVSGVGVLVGNFISTPIRVFINAAIVSIGCCTIIGICTNILIL